MPLPPGDPPHGVGLAIDAWNMLSLPGITLATVADILGMDDMEMLVEQLIVIQRHQGRRP